MLVAVLVSAGNALVRKIFDTSSNAYLELQWYLFSAVFLFCAGYTLLRDEHVRIDVVAGRFSRRTQVWIDVFGTVFFLLPMALVFIYLSWPVFVRTWVQQEISTNAGGLLIWPARLLVPVGFALLALQAVSELVKRIGVPPRRRARSRRPAARPLGRAGARRRDPPARRGKVLMELLAHNMAPIMFAALVVFLLLGYPVAFALAANGIFFGLVGIELGLLQPAFFQALPERVWGVMSNDTLLAVPFFTFMGLILERSGMAEDLLDTIGQVFGPLRGGLAFAVIFVGALLAATTGVVAASVISMGLISLPIMLRYGYDRRFASGVIAASGTLAQIIPPSLVLIIMADQLGRSVGDMYAGAIIPGLVLTGLYALYAVGVTIVKPAWAPALPLEARRLREADGSGGTTSLAILVAISSAVARGLRPAVHPARDSPRRRSTSAWCWPSARRAAFAFLLAAANRLLGLGFLSRLAQQVVFVLIPPLGLIFLVLGTIFLGWATPTEGGAMGAAGALAMAVGAAPAFASRSCARRWTRPPSSPPSWSSSSSARGSSASPSTASTGTSGSRSSW